MRILWIMILSFGINFLTANASEVASQVESKKDLLIEKVIDVPVLVSGEGNLNEAIGIETLQDIITPLMNVGVATPYSTTIKLGVSKACHCANIKLFRISNKVGEKPTQINDDAIRGFSADTKTVNIILEVTADSKLYLKAQIAEKLEPGKSFEWVAASEAVIPAKAGIQS